MDQQKGTIRQEKDDFLRVDVGNPVRVFLFLGKSACGSACGFLPWE
jgi:hypothetical protein